MSVFNAAFRACSTSTWTHNLPRQTISRAYSTWAQSNWQGIATHYSTSRERSWKNEVTSLNQEIKKLRDLLEDPNGVDNVNSHLKQAYFAIEQLKENGAPAESIKLLYNTAHEIECLAHRRKWNGGKT